MSNVISIVDLMKQQEIAIYDPVAVVQAAFNTMDDLVVNGGTIEFVDPSNPVVFSITNQGVLASTVMEHAADLNRQQYPYMARTMDDLYHHMSDKDYIGRFANPSRVQCTYRCQIDDLMQHMVEVPELNQYKLVIPRNSYLTVDATEFTLLYPIVIRRQQFGKFSVTYDTDQNSPLSDLSTNIIKHKVVRIGGKDYLTFDFELIQCVITTRTDMISRAADTIIRIPLEGNYHHCRVFNNVGAGTSRRRTELSTTHSALVYNARQPTAVIKVEENVVTISIPTIYISSGMLSGEIQADVYTTKGALDMPLGGYAMNEFVFQYRSTFKEEIDRFVAPLELMNTVAVYSAGTTSGGSAAMTFDELFEQVISNGLGDPTLPVADVKLKYALRALGYDVMLYVDNMPTRIYLATRDLPIPKDDNLHSPISSAIETFAFKGSLSEITVGVIENYEAYTITPDALFTISNGIVYLQSDTVISSLTAMQPDKLAAALTDNSYFWTPFYYVIDISNHQLNVRPYHLDKPDILSTSFETENTSTTLTCSTTSYNIQKVKTGYIIDVYTACSDDYLLLDPTELWAQMSFAPTGSNVLASLNGELYGTIEGGQVWRFYINTNYHVDSNHDMVLTNFTMMDTVQRNIPVPLENTFNVIYGVDTNLPPTFKAIDTDRIVGYQHLTPNAHAITHEYMDVRFGYALTHLWTQARSFADIEYQRYLSDVIDVYTADVYEPFPDTGLKIKVVDGVVTYNKTHSAGDPVIIDGEVQYIARAGDYIYDVNGQPMPVADRYMMRNIDILFMEAAFRFADNDLSRTYFDNTVMSIVTWVTQDMVNLGPRMLDETWIRFTPKKTTSTVNVQVDNEIVQISATQALTVHYHLIDEITSTREVRDMEDIERITSEVLSVELAKSVISVDDLQTKLKAAVGNSVLNVQLLGLGGDKNLQLVIMPEASQRLTIGKRVRSRSSGELYVEDDITIVLHSEKDTYDL